MRLQCPKTQKAMSSSPSTFTTNQSGAYSEWRPFYDTFNSLIHSNKALCDIQRFHYLKSSLQGGAKAMLQCLELSVENYIVAWNWILEGHANKNHVRAIREMPSVTKEKHASKKKFGYKSLKRVEMPCQYISRFNYIEIWYNHESNEPPTYQQLWELMKQSAIRWNTFPENMRIQQFPFHESSSLILLLSSTQVPFWSSFSRIILV